MGILLFFFATGFIRNHVGDVIVVVFLYSVLSIFFSIKPIHKALSILFITTTIEFSQIFLAPTDSGFQELFIGSTFDKLDILFYIIGLILIFGLETYKISQKRSNT